MADDSESLRGIDTEMKDSIPHSATQVASQNRFSAALDGTLEGVNTHGYRDGDRHSPDSKFFSRVRRASMVDLLASNAEPYKKPRLETLSSLRYEHSGNPPWNISQAAQNSVQPLSSVLSPEKVSSSHETSIIDETMDENRQQSGMYSPGSIRLPSFSSISSNVNPGGGTEHARRDSAHESQLDPNLLRQQLIARDQTITNLRREQEQLQSSMLRARSRYEALETKSQVTDHEIAAVSEEKNRLQQEVATLATQVEQLTLEREELQTQARADGAQWRQIMSMSSKLQMQNVEESRRFTADREQWAKHREKLEQRINELEAGSPTGTDSLLTLEVSQDLDRNLTLSSMPETQLRQEVGDLRQRCQELEELLKAVMKESASIERTGTLLKEVRKRMGSGNSHRGSSDPSA